MQKRDALSFLSTVMLYLLFVGVYLLLFSRHTLSVADNVAKTEMIELSLQEYQPTVEEPIIEEESVEPKPIVEKPIEEKLIEKPIVEKPILKPTPTPKPQLLKPKPKIKPKKKLKTKPIAQKKPISPKPSQTSQQSNKAQQSTAKEKNRFFAQIRAKIDKYKTYPRNAIRRGMEGGVRVSFVILPDGNVADIVIDGSDIFHTSIKNAIGRAFPISVKDSPVSLPESVSFTIFFKLR